MKAVNFVIYICILLLFPIGVEAQQKYEREYRIKSKEIPKIAKDFIDSIGADSRIRWYQEEGLYDTSLEAKFKKDKKKFSVEFDTLGNLQDVEFIITKRDINANAYIEIERKLNTLYKKWKLQKIQIHYAGTTTDVLESLRAKEPTESVVVLYEIVFRGKDQGIIQLYEITFNEEGEMLDILQIIRDKADHLEY